MTGKSVRHRPGRVGMLLAAAVLAALLLAGCGGLQAAVPQADYDAVVAERDALQRQAETLSDTADERQQELEAAREALEAAQQQLEAIQEQADSRAGEAEALQQQLDDMKTELEIMQKAQAAASQSQSPVAQQAQGTAPAASQEAVDPPAAAEPQPQAAAGPMVWIPRTGSKYHSHAGCSNMKSPSQVALDTAIAQGYGACKKCY